LKSNLIVNNDFNIKLKTELDKTILEESKDAPSKKIEIQEITDYKIKREKIYYKITFIDDNTF
jgi:hypothetical protein